MHYRCRVGWSLALALALLVAVSSSSSAQLWVPQNLGFSAWEDGGLSLALDENGLPGLTYHGSGGGLYYGAYDGSSWSTGLVDSGLWAGRGSALTYLGSTPHIAYRASDGANHHLGYAAGDTGGGWALTTFNDVAASDPRHFGIAADSGGNLGIAYLDLHDVGLGDEMLYYRYFDGSSWSSRGTVTDQVVNMGGVGFAYGPGDVPHIAYVYEDGFLWTPALATGNGSWSQNIGLGGTAPGDVAQYLALDLDAAGYPHLAWFNNDPFTGVGEVNYAWFDGSAWTKETALPANFATALADRRWLDMAMDSWGYSHLLFYDPVAEQVLYSWGKAGELWTPPRVLAEAAASWVSLQVDDFNVPHFAYHSGDTVYYGFGDPVPEPGTALLLLGGLGALAAYRRRRRAARG